MIEHIAIPFRKKDTSHNFSRLLQVFVVLNIVLHAFAANAQTNIFDMVRQGTPEGLRSMIEATPGLAHSRDENGSSPLILAAYHGKAKMVEILAPIDDVNYMSSYGTALMAACVKGHVDIATTLLKHNADPLLADGDGNTPLLFAAMFQNKSLALLLLEHGADPNAKNVKNFSALDYAKMHQHTELIIRFENF